MVLEMSWLKNNKHIFYNYRNCVLQTRSMFILCGDTIYKCNKFISAEENEDNCYIFYMRVQTTADLYETHYVVWYLRISGDVGYVTTRTTGQTMLKVLGAMLTYTQQNKSSEDIVEIFKKKGYYLDKCIFKFLDLCSSVRLRMMPNLCGWTM
jgi:hypothetical protein